jgi:hypothetical protein
MALPRSITWVFVSVCVPARAAGAHVATTASAIASVRELFERI